jgi:hypothetical protein
MAKYFFYATLLGSALAFAQSAPTLLQKAQVEQLVPTNYFFAGKTATTQVRNAGGVRFANDKFILLSLVDNSGYSSGVQEKYQGLLITQVPLQVGDKTIAPGSYGFGMTSPQHFDVLDINADEIAGGTPGDLPSGERAVPLKIDLSADGVVAKMGRRTIVFKFVNK